jgi:hypothetical protein
MILLAIILLITIAGISKAVMDKINFHYTKSIFLDMNAIFWSPKLSWMNKWKDGIEKRGPRFFGSTTFLVWTTDAWHLFGMFYAVSFAIGISLTAKFYPLWYVIIAYTLHRVVFEIVFTYILKRR